MPYQSAPASHAAWRKLSVALAALSAAVLTTACAGSGALDEQNLAYVKPKNTSGSSASHAGTEKSGGTELMKATEYWRKEYAKNPKDRKIALSLARNLKALGQKRRALAILQHASTFHATDPEVASEYGRLALDLDQVGVAKRLLSVADDPTKPDWKVVSAQGTVLAKEGKFGEAIPYFKRAAAMAPGQASVLNNLALAHMMSGDANTAERLLRKATTAGGPHAAKARQNLALALGVQGKYSESKAVAAGVLAKEEAHANADYLKKLVRLAPKKAPAPNAAASKAVVQGPLRPEDIIAQATAASAKAKIAKIAKPKATNAKKLKKAPTKVVRTVASSASDVKRETLAFKPSSF